VHPFLIDAEILGTRLTIPSGVVFTLSGLAVGGLLYWFLLPRSARRWEHLAFAAAAAGTALVGARLLGFALDLGVLGTERPLEVFAASGSTVLGGIAGGGLFAAAYLKIRRGGSVTLRTFDAAAAAFAVGDAVMRVGCLFQGCCFGKICAASPLAVTYPPDWIMHRFFGLDIPYGPRLPFPLIAAASLLLIAFVLFIVLHRETRAGTAAALFFILFGAYRFAIEFIRDEPLRLFLGPLSFAQWFALACLPAGIGLLAYSRRRRESALPGATPATQA